MMVTSAAVQHSIRIVELERNEFITQRAFDDTLARIRTGLGQPNFAEFITALEAIEDWDKFRSTVAAEAGSSGLMVFMQLDLGGVIAKDADAVSYRSVRIIAGNPVTMESMTRTTPAAGAFAPVTILVFEASDGVHVRYDTISSAIADDLTEDAATIAAHLDASVLDLISSASSTTP